MFAAHIILASSYGLCSLSCRLQARHITGSGRAPISADN